MKDLEEKKALLNLSVDDDTDSDEECPKTATAPQKGHLVVALPGLLLLTFSTIYVTMPCTYLPVVLQESFNITEATTALIISASSLAYVGSCFISPKLDDMFDQKQVMVVSVVLFMISQAVFSFVVYLPQAWLPAVGITLRAVAGFTSGIFENIFSIFLYRKYPDNIGGIAACLECSANIGFISGPILGGILYTWTNDITATTLAPILPTLLVCAFFAWVTVSRKKKRLNSQSTKENGGFLKVLGTWQMMLLVFLPFYCSIVLNVPLTITAPHVQETFGGDAIITGLLFLIMAVGYWIGSVVTGLLTDIPRYQYTGMWFFALCPFLYVIGNCMIGPAFFLPFKPSLYWIGAGFFVSSLAFGIGCGPTIRLLLSMWKELHPTSQVDYTAYITSIFLVTFQLGEGIGNAVGGIMYEYMSFNRINTLFGLSLVPLGIINLVFVMLTRKKLDTASEEISGCGRSSSLSTRRLSSVNSQRNEKYFDSSDDAFDDPIYLSHR